MSNNIGFTNQLYYDYLRVNAFHEFNHLAYRMFYDNKYWDEEGNTLKVSCGILPIGHYLDSKPAYTSDNPNMLSCLDYIHGVCVHNKKISLHKGDLLMVFGPDVAYYVARSAEMTDYLDQHPHAAAQVQGMDYSHNGFWGLPDKYHYYNLYVDDTSVVRAQGQDPRKYTCPRNTAYVVSKRMDLPFFAVRLTGCILALESNNG